MDYTRSKYIQLLKTLIGEDYEFQTFEDFLQTPFERSIVLRHDVDLLPKNSLAFAQIQSDYGIKGVYYFRAVPESWNESIILEIASLGHEIGYHYESLTTCRGDVVKGIEDFEKNLQALRQLVQVSTVCMHGSPMSKFDSKDLWKTYDYRNFGIIGEPYFDVDFGKVFYLTDTGRRWDGEKVSVRDKVRSGFDISFRTTNEIILAADKSSLPNQMMFTFHPQRWNNNSYLWAKEFLNQNIKNIIKQYLFVRR